MNMMLLQEEGVGYIRRRGPARLYQVGPMSVSPPSLDSRIFLYMERNKRFRKGNTMPLEISR